MQLNWIPGITLIAIAIAGSLLFNLMRTWRNLRAWKYPAQWHVQAVEQTEFPKSLQGRISYVFQDFATLGYLAIGHCAAGPKPGERWSYCSVWRRSDDVAEISIIFPRVITRPSIGIGQISIAIGREFTDGSSLAIDNTSSVTARIDDGAIKRIHLENLWKIEILDEIAKLWIASWQLRRTAWVPDDVVSYKKRDLKTHCELMLASKKYVMDPKDNCLHLSVGQVLRLSVFPLGQSKIRRQRVGYKWQVGQMLRQLGFDENYNPIPTRAFPVKLIEDTPP
jgi:hypothetical protein